MTQEKTGGHIMAEAHAQFDKWVAEFKAAAETSNLELDVDGLEMNMFIFIYNQEYRAVEAAIEAHAAELSAARLGALEEAAQSICGNCSQGKFPFYESMYSCWSHEWFDFIGCRNLETCIASNIWDLIKKPAPAVDGVKEGEWDTEKQ
jgi:hypothetical protein